jgi:hypothetical protein
MVSFAEIVVGQSYSRPQLAAMWGYASHEALSRGVVTPKEDNKIILFVTREKQVSAEQYEDELVDHILLWEGPNDHFAEDRMLEAGRTGDQVHLFYRERHHSDFTYIGQLSLYCCERLTDGPSRFVFRVRRAAAQAA